MAVFVMQPAPFQLQNSMTLYNAQSNQATARVAQRASEFANGMSVGGDAGLPNKSPKIQVIHFDLLSGNIIPLSAIKCLA